MAGGNVRKQLDALWAELRAINFWDQEYFLQKTRDEIDRAAWRARRQRVTEIEIELDELSCAFLPVPSDLISLASGNQNSEPAVGKPVRPRIPQCTRGRK